MLKNFFTFENNGNLKEEHNKKMKLKTKRNDFRTCFESFPNDSVEAKEDNHCSKFFAVRVPWRKRNSIDQFMRRKFTINGQKCALLIIGGFLFVLSLIVWFSCFFKRIFRKKSKMPSSAVLKKLCSLKPSCWKRRKKRSMLKKKKNFRLTSFVPSRGLNVKPCFTVSAVNSSWTKKEKRW